MDNEKFTVKEVSEVEAKSTAQIEEELLQKHEESFNATNATAEVEKVEAAPEETPSEETSGLDETSVLEYIKNRYDKEINSVDELFEKKKQAEASMTT